MDCTLPGSSTCGIFQARIQESVAVPSAKGLLFVVVVSVCFYFFYFIFKFYKIVLVLPNIEMNPPQVYMCSPS